MRPVVSPVSAITWKVRQPPDQLHDRLQLGHHRLTGQKRRISSNIHTPTVTRKLRSFVGPLYFDERDTFPLIIRSSIFPLPLESLHILREENPSSCGLFCAQVADPVRPASERFAL